MVDTNNTLDGDNTVTITSTNAITTGKAMTVAENNGIIFDLKGIVPRELVDIRI